METQPGCGQCSCSDEAQRVANGTSHVAVTNKDR
jgi:hypothetical protein